MLVTRDLTIRYKRSILGVWWTLLNPMVSVLVFWVVFSNIFRQSEGGVPFIVYMTPGVLLAAFFSQGVVASGSAIVGGRSILAQLYVPPEVFALASGVAAAVNFLISLIPIILIQIISGVGIPWTFALAPISAFAMLMFVTGAGLIVASLAVLFYDVFDLVGVLTMVVTFLSATFYPLSIVPERLRFFIELNPIYHHLTVFRSITYGGDVALVNLLVTAISAMLMLSVGVYTFARSWKNVVVTI